MLKGIINLIAQLQFIILMSSIFCTNRQYYVNVLSMLFIINYEKRLYKPH